MNPWEPRCLTAVSRGKLFARTLGVGRSWSRSWSFCGPGSRKIRERGPACQDIRSRREHRAPRVRAPCGMPARGLGEFPQPVTKLASSASIQARTTLAAVGPPGTSLAVFPCRWLAGPPRGCVLLKSLRNLHHGSSSRHLKSNRTGLGVSAGALLFRSHHVARPPNRARSAPRPRRGARSPGAPWPGASPPRESFRAIATWRARRRRPCSSADAAR